MFVQAGHLHAETSFRGCDQDPRERSVASVSYEYGLIEVSMKCGCRAYDRALPIHLSTRGQNSFGLNRAHPCELYGKDSS